MNKSKDRLQAAMRTFDLMREKDNKDATRRRVANGDETLLIGALAREPNAGQFGAEAREEQGCTKRILCRKLQGPVAGMAQAAILLGGQLETDQTGFVITFNGAFSPAHHQRGHEWRVEGKGDERHLTSDRLPIV